MKILHLSSESSWRGGEQQIAYLISELQQKNIDNLVACRAGSAFEKHCQHNNIPHFSLPFQGSFDLSTAWTIRTLCKQKSIDLVHIHSAKSHSLAVLSHVMGSRTPLILSRRVDFPIRSNFLTQWKYNHPAVRRIVCVSEAIEQIVRKNVRRPERCATVHSGIDTNRIGRAAGFLKAQYQLPKGVLLIGNTSALAGHKDYYTFIRTAAVFRKYKIPARFFIIGDGPEREALQAYIQEKSLTDYIFMTGFLSNIGEVLPELDIFLMTSEMEGLGTSVLDAFAASVPVVATRAGGIPEMVIHQETGMLAEVKDPQTLARHLKTLSENPPLAQKLAENATLLLHQHFTKEKMAAGTLDIYQEIMAGQY